MNGQFPGIKMNFVALFRVETFLIFAGIYTNVPLLAITAVSRQHSIETPNHHSIADRRMKPQSRAKGMYYGY